MRNVSFLSSNTQAKERFRAIWPGGDIGILQGPCKQYGRQVTIASVQTARQAGVLEQLKYQGIQLAIVDEVKRW